jgi:CheY-like chemotaxis protein
MDAVGKLAGGIAHDFNNVLGGIMGAAELLFMEAGDNPRQKKFLNIILDSSHRATDLIKKLLTFGRQKPLSTVPVDVHNAVHEAIALLECSIDKKVRIEQQLQAPHSIVNGDLSQLQTVFINLGINASHAMPDGGTLSFSSSCLQLDEIAAHAHELEPGPYIKIQVRDTGIGISPENISRIFEPFFTTKPSGKGTGLGLAVSFGIIRQHLGAISVYSEPGNGAVFNILLPLSNLQCHEKDTNEAIHHGKGTILVIDDEKIIRETAADILRHFGYEVITAASARDGIEAFKADRQNIRLVLLDMIMPEMNGRECFERLQSICPDVKVVLASGFSKEEDIEMMQEKGLCGFIHKPYSLRELSHLLNRIFV